VVTGKIEVPSGRDLYTFNATAGEAVYFDELTGTCNDLQIRWELIAPDDTVLFHDWFGDADEGCDWGRVTLPQGGVYTLVVYGDQTGTGAYSFALWRASDTQFSLD
jgi:hypothetical protein